MGITELCIHIWRKGIFFLESKKKICFFFFKSRRPVALSWKMKPGHVITRYGYLTHGRRGAEHRRHVPNTTSRKNLANNIKSQRKRRGYYHCQKVFFFKGIFVSKVLFFFLREKFVWKVQRKRNQNQRFGPRHSKRHLQEANPLHRDHGKEEEGDRPTKWARSQPAWPHQRSLQ